jgi:hypothetical protein
VDTDEQYLLRLLNRLDKGKGVTEADLDDAIFWKPLVSLLDQGKIYEPIKGVFKAVTLLTKR